MADPKSPRRRDPAAAIGDLIIAFQELENYLILVLASLTDQSDDHVGVVIATQLSFRKLGVAVDALLHHRTKDKSLLSAFADILKESRDLEAERNKYVHSFYDWREITNGGITYERMKNRVRTGKGLSPDYELLDTEKVDDVSNRLRILTAAVDLFFEQLQNAKVIKDRRSIGN